MNKQVSNILKIYAENIKKFRNCTDKTLDGNNDGEYTSTIRILDHIVFAWARLKLPSTGRWCSDLEFCFGVNGKLRVYRMLYNPETDEEPIFYKVGRNRTITYRTFIENLKRLFNILDYELENSETLTVKVS